MAEYIEREALIYYLTRPTGFRTNCEDCTDIDCLDCIIEEVIRDRPAADVAPVMHGRWLCVDTDTEQFFLCNRCKKKEYWESNYCPNCGCKMDLEG